MARNHAAKNPPAPDTLALPVEEIAAADYASNMFSDGHNRTATYKSGAKAYDAAAHTEDAEVALAYGDAAAAESILEGTSDTFHSRDGTDAAGRDDEFGGSLGGTERELDDLEATASPVDRTPHMKD